MDTGTYVSIFVLAPLFTLLVTLPFTYNWVAKRKKYLARLNSIGFDENAEGLICKLEGAPKSTEFLFPAEYEAPENPGIYRAQGSNLLANAGLCLYYFIVYKRRIGRQRRAYSPEQLALLERIAKADGECFGLKDEFVRKF